MNNKDLKKNQGEDKSLLESVLSQAYHGVPELKIDEKRKYLGTFAERVISYLTVSELTKKINPKIINAMHNEQAYVVLVKGNYIKRLGDYIAYAQDNNLKFKVVSRPDSKSDIVLVVASKRALKKNKIE